MPVIKSAKKRMRQNVKRRERNFPIRSRLKTLIKRQLTLSQEGKFEEAKKHLPAVYSMIDTAVKKNILHSNTAARRKSLLARALNDAEKGGSKPAAAEKPKAKPSSKEKAEAKVSEKATEDKEKTAEDSAE